MRRAGVVFAAIIIVVLCALGAWVWLNRAPSSSISTPVAVQTETSGPLAWLQHVFTAFSRTFSVSPAPAQDASSTSTYHPQYDKDLAIYDAESPHAPLPAGSPLLDDVPNEYLSSHALRGTIISVNPASILVRPIGTRDTVTLEVATDTIIFAFTPDPADVGLWKTWEQTNDPNESLPPTPYEHTDKSFSDLMFGAAVAAVVNGQHVLNIGILP